MGRTPHIPSLLVAHRRAEWLTALGPAPRPSRTEGAQQDPGTGSILPRRVCRCLRLTALTLASLQHSVVLPACASCLISRCLCASSVSLSRTLSFICVQRRSASLLLHAPQRHLIMDMQSTFRKSMQALDCLQAHVWRGTTSPRHPTLDPVTTPSPLSPSTYPKRARAPVSLTTSPLATLRSISSARFCASTFSRTASCGLATSK